MNNNKNGLNKAVSKPSKKKLIATSFFSSLLLVGATLLPSTEAIASKAHGNSAKFNVGTSKVFVVDESRPFDLVREGVVGTGSEFCLEEEPHCLSEGARTLVGHIWYPVKKKATKHAIPARFCDLMFGRQTSENYCSVNSEEYSVYLETYSSGLVCDLSDLSSCTLKSSAISGKTQVEIDELIDAALQERYNRTTGAFLYELDAAPVASRGGPYPLIILSHGNTGSAFEMAEIGRRLAQSGYIIIGLDIAGNAARSQVGKEPNFSVNNPGVVLDFGDVYRGTNIISNVGAGVFTETIVDRIEDVKVIIARMHAMNNDYGSSFHGKINMDSIGLIGFSLGSVIEGGILASGIIPEIDAIANVGGLGVQSSVEFGADPNIIGALASPEAVDMTVPRIPIIYNSGREDNVIVGFENIFTNAWGIPTVEEPFPSLTNETVGTVSKATGPAFYTLMGDMDHSGYAGPAPSLFNWPDLQNDVRDRVFNPPGGSYIAIEAERAHTINAKVHKAFFDCYLKHKQKGLKRLLKIEKKFGDDGLELVVAKNYCGCRERDDSSSD